MSAIGKAEAVLLGVGVLLAGYLAYKFFGIGSDLVSGNNSLTRKATDAAGKPVTAYVDKGPLGTLGGAFNAASGGWLASAGNWIGGKLADVTNPTPPVNDIEASKARYRNGGINTGTDPAVAVGDGWDGYGGINIGTDPAAAVGDAWYGYGNGYGIDGMVNLPPGM